MHSVTSNAVYNNLITLLRTNNFRVFTIAGDGNHSAIKISYDGSIQNYSIGFLIITRYSVLIVHVELAANSQFIRVKKNVLAEIRTGDTVVSNTTNSITIAEPYNWNFYNILVISGNKNIWSNLTIGLL